MASGTEYVFEDKNNFLVITGTTSENTNEGKVIGLYPTGWDPSNAIIIGYTNLLSSGQWQSNSKEVQVFSVNSGNSTSINATVTHSAFTNKTMKVLLKKI